MLGLYFLLFFGPKMKSLFRYFLFFGRKKENPFTVKLTGCSVSSGPLGGFWLSCQFYQRRHLESWSYCSVRADTGHQRRSRSWSRWQLLPGGLPIRRWMYARSIISCGHSRGQQSDRRSAGSLPGDHHRRPVSSNKHHTVNGHQKEYMPWELSTVLLLLPNR